MSSKRRLTKSSQESYALKSYTRMVEMGDTQRRGRCAHLSVRVRIPFGYQADVVERKTRMLQEHVP